MIKILYNKKENAWLYQCYECFGCPPTFNLGLYSPNCIEEKGNTWWPTWFDNNDSPEVFLKKYNYFGMSADDWLIVDEEDLECELLVEAKRALTKQDSLQQKTVYLRPEVLLQPNG